jgi:peptidoglycan/LPS O-acetylase OafA/YrhL
MTLIPLPPSADIRGGDEMYPLNGPAWSLFFEYCANILYALFIRRFSKKLLSAFVAAAGFALIYLTVTSPNGDIIGGWMLDSEQLRIGFTRLIYPFFAGLLLFRVSKIGKIKNSFLWCSLLVIIALAMPRIGGSEHLWVNGIYDSAVIVLLFPLIVWLGASGSITRKYSSKICHFLGEISYPLYLSHYPLIYIYMGYISTNDLHISQSYGYAILTFASSILLAWVWLRLYDLPVRKWLTKIWK